MTWKSPHWLWALALLPLALVGLVLWNRDRRRARAAYADPNVLDISFPRRVAALRTAAVLCGLLAAAAGIVAMARPSVTVKGKEKRSTVVLAIDTSKSMQKTDVTPSRLGAGVEAAKRFLDAAPKDAAIGFVTFDNGARVRVTPTTDRAAVTDALKNLPIGVGTAIGDAIQTSLQSIQASGALATTPAPGEPSAARILLLTDGANSVGSDPQDAARRAQQLHVPVYTVQIGQDTSAGGGLTPVETLTAVANTTGGVFTQSTSTADVSQVYKDIGASLASVQRLEERSVWAVLAAVLSLLAGAGLLAAAELRPHGPPAAKFQPTGR